MKILNIALISIFLIICPWVEASPQAALPTLSLEASKDPYSHGYTFTKESKKYADQKIDIQRFRHPILIEETKQFLETANIFHEGQYWKTRIEKSASIQKVYFHALSQLHNRSFLSY